MKYHIITFGCQMNKADSERIADSLEKKGYKPALKVSEADLMVVNMCSIRQSAVDRIYGLQPKLKNLKAKKILTGCILRKDERKLRGIFDCVKPVPWLQDHIISKSKNSAPAYIPISNGCNNFCAYCVVPFTRGKLTCRSHETVINEVKKTVKRKNKEIWLLGQNVNDYISGQKTKDKTPKINFAELLKMVNNIPGDFKFFFTSPHPKNFSDELIAALAECRKFGKRLNLPVQSGDNKILKKMNRNYTVKQYETMVKKIRKKIPDISISTDVIVGFPGETKTQFNNTVKLFNKIKFDLAYISKYSPRPGTAAAQLKDNVPFKEKKRREKCLRELLLL